MSESEETDLVRRFGEVERKVIRQGKIAGLLVLVVFGLAAFSVYARIKDEPSAPGVVKATKFVLVDDQGNRLAMLDENASGLGSLRFFRNDAVAVEVGAPGGHPGAAIWQGHNKLAVLVSQGRKGDGFIELHGEDGVAWKAP